MAETAELFQRVWTDLLARPSGPMSFRFLLQPAMAMIFAVRDGFQDARTGRSPYFWTVLTEPEKRPGRLREGLTSNARVILLGLTMDVIYQLRVLGTIHPFEAIVVALFCAFIPYLLLRGPAARIARWWVRPVSSDKRL